MDSVGGGVTGAVIGAIVGGRGAASIGPNVNRGFNPLTFGVVVTINDSPEARFR